MTFSWKQKKAGVLTTAAVILMGCAEQNESFSVKETSNNTAQSCSCDSCGNIPLSSFESNTKAPCVTDNAANKLRTIWSRGKDIDSSQTAGRAFPGNSGGADRAEVTSGRLVFTNDLIDVPSQTFGYSNGIRNSVAGFPQNVQEIREHYRNFAKQLATSNRIKVTETTPKIYVASRVYNGAGGLPSVGVYNDKVVVVLRIYKPEVHLEEAAAAVALMSDLGIGPRFYGITECDHEHSAGIVMDLIRGDGPSVMNEKLSKTHFLQLIRAQKLVRFLGLKRSGYDFEYFVGPNELTVYDADFVETYLFNDTLEPKNYELPTGFFRTMVFAIKRSNRSDKDEILNTFFAVLKDKYGPDEGARLVSELDEMSVPNR